MNVFIRQDVVGNTEQPLDNYLDAKLFFYLSINGTF